MDGVVRSHARVRRPRRVPGADLGVIKALAAAGVERRAIFNVAEAWRPWRGYATIHLWASLSK